jgi:peroxiredoxin
MKKALFLAGAVVLALIGTAFTLGENNEIETLKIGEKAPMVDYKMKSTDGRGYSLATAAEDNGLLVIFSCNTCPFVVGREGKSEGWEGRYNEVYAAAKSAGIGAVLVNSNEAKRKDVDSMEEMQKHAKENGYQMPYVVDENHQLADAFGARTTPHVFLFDSKMQLVYTGAIDDNVDAADAVKEPWLINAMRAVARGQEVPVAESKPIGCSIKRVSK